MVLGFKLFVRRRLVAVCFIIACHNNFVALENWLSYQCPSSMLVVITLKKELAGS
jgi:hypothetical protein